jgi:hypothetical protein
MISTVITNEETTMNFTPLTITQGYAQNEFARYFSKANRLCLTNNSTDRNSHLIQFSKEILSSIAYLFGGCPTLTELATFCEQPENLSQLPEKVAALLERSLPEDTVICEGFAEISTVNNTPQLALTECAITGASIPYLYLDEKEAEEEIKEDDYAHELNVERVHILANGKIHFPDVNATYDLHKVSGLSEKQVNIQRLKAFNFEDLNSDCPF